MSLKMRLFQSASKALKAGIGLLGQHTSAMVSANLVELLSPIITIDTRLGVVRFHCAGNIPLLRAETLLTKEPETIEWIDTFSDGDVFWDIGANVGVYSLYAALKPNIRVLAYEPAACNYYVLNKNIEINRMDERIESFCIAFNDNSRLDYFYMGSTELGSSMHSFEKAVDWKGNAMSATFKQAMIGFTIDQFVEQFHPAFPNHIKIDVDGNEDKIISGAQKTLSDRRLKSLLIELDINNTEYCGNVTAQLEKAGLVLQSKRHAPMFDHTEFASVYNHIFVRP
jgi:FkbM family methyltransferase